MNKRKFLAAILAVFMLITVFSGVPSRASDESSEPTSAETVPTATPGITSDNPAFRPAVAVDAAENDMSVYPEPRLESVFDTSDLPELDAEAYILIDRRTGQTICSKNADQSMFPASTTKIMTGILAIEMGEMDTLMLASERAVQDIGPDGSNIGIIAGERLRLDNLLDALLVRSANETANIIAENICDSRGEFIDLMNEKARELGATGTHFTNTSGYHEESHYTTAYDLAKIADYAMDNGTFREIVAKRSIILAPTNKHATWDALSTTNRLLTDDYPISGYAITGVKTGYHSASGYCVVASGLDTNTGMELLCVVLGVFGTEAGTNAKRFQIAVDLLSYGFENFRLNTFIRDRELLGTIGVLGGDNIDTVDAFSDGTVKMFLPVNTDLWNVSKIEYIKSEVTAPVSRGDSLGYVEFRNDGVFAGRVNVVAASDVPASKGGVRQTPERGDTGSAMSAISLSGGAIGTFREDGATDGTVRTDGSDETSPRPSPDAGGTNHAANADEPENSGDSVDSNSEEPEGSDDATNDSGDGPDGGTAAEGEPDSGDSGGTAGVLQIVLAVLIGCAVLLSIVRTIAVIRHRRALARGRLRYPPGPRRAPGGSGTFGPQQYRSPYGRPPVQNGNGAPPAQGGYRIPPRRGRGYTP